MTDLLIRNVDPRMAELFRESAGIRRLAYHEYLERLVGLHQAALQEHIGSHGAESWTQTTLDILDLAPVREVPGG